MRKSIFRNVMFCAAMLCGALNAWAGQAYVYAYADPQDGGFVYVSTSNNAPATYTETSSVASQGGFMSSGNKTFYLFCQAQEGYVFKGWKKTSQKNAAVSDNSTANMTNGWQVQQTATGVGEQASYYTAIFATVQAPAQLTCQAAKVGASAETTLAIKHAHAGNVTFALSGTDAADFAVTEGFSSEAAGSHNALITFAPASAGVKSAQLTISSDNGLADCVVELTATATDIYPNTLTHKAIDLTWDTDYTLADLFESNSDAPIVLTSSDVTIVDNAFRTQFESAITITASQAATDDYFAAEVTYTFSVGPQADYASEVLDVPATSSKIEADATYDLFFENPNQEVFVLSFEYEKSFAATRTFSLYQQIAGEWVKVASFNTAGTELDAAATGVRFQFAGTGLGSATVKNVKVVRPTFLSADEEVEVAFEALPENGIIDTITVAYGNIHTVRYELMDVETTNGEATLTLTPLETINNGAAQAGEYHFLLEATCTAANAVITATARFYTVDGREVLVPITLTLEEPVVPTELEQVETAKQVKILENGQVRILKNGILYTISGQMIK